MSYNLFYWIHIVSYIIWLAAFAGSLFFAWKTGKSYQMTAEKKFMKLERTSTGIGAHLGALGILISGGAMVSIPAGPQWGWFDFDLYSWLAVKQLLFFIILILVGFSIRRSIVFKRNLRGEESTAIGDATRKKWRKAYELSLMVYLLVVVNTLLGLYKPF